MRTCPWGQHRPMDGGLRCSGHPINATQQVDGGTHKTERGEVSKVIPLAPALLARSCAHPVQLRKHLADALATGPGSVVAGSPWLGFLLHLLLPSWATASLRLR